MNKISAEHLARRACVYVRQSTPDQVQNNLESQRRQYALVERAKQLGWHDVEVIDEDLGCSGSGVHRPGFERLLGALCEGSVGAVLSVEASRLARNGRDWHTLLEFCSLVGALLIDAEGIYDPLQTNDRLLLGMKGTISEMELASFRQRAQAALDQKAKRGELFKRVPIGYVRTEGDRVEKDPDERVRAAIDLVFCKFAEHCAPSLLLVLRTADQAACNRRRRQRPAACLEGTTLSRPLESAAESHVRRCIRLWPQQDDGTHRTRPQARCADETASR